MDENEIAEITNYIVVKSKMYIDMLRNGECSLQEMHRQVSKAIDIPMSHVAAMAIACTVYQQEG